MNILVVEDEIGLAEAVGAILRGEGYQVDLAHDGEVGLQYALTGDYDCILLDIMLPKMNGLDVLSYLRVKEIETPVVLLTARSETEDKIKGLDCGADDYLTKPFSMGELLARIRDPPQNGRTGHQSTLWRCNAGLEERRDHLRREQCGIGTQGISDDGDASLAGRTDCDKGTVRYEDLGQ